MHNFKYVTERELAPVKSDLISIINSAQSILCPYFTLKYYFVGSVRRNMVTYDEESNVGFDFDINIEVSNENGKYSAKEIKAKVRNALDRVAPSYGYDYAEDSTRVLTIKFKDRQRSKIIHSCDFAIVNNYTDKDGNSQQQYIRFNKAANTYSWVSQPHSYYNLHEKAEWIKNNCFVQEIRELYLSKKNKNTDPDKHSRTIYAETIHEICQKHGYYKN